ncbi:MAG: DNA-protecting protein DprA [Bacteroidetes bacterium HGW-Bacteroidetes-22]|nr:MAG: DNA-protecting protein DprA [Bacteroidetes bacterium HGW-Bacteroidetes-22]
MSLIHQVALTLIPGVGDVNARRLVSYCGGVEAVFKERRSALTKIPGIGEMTAASIIDQDVLSRAEHEIAFMEKFGIKPLFYLDDDYPWRLKGCADSPVMLYFKGNANLNTSRTVGIVGTRRITDYGREVCKALVEGLPALNVTTISGLAFGVDTCAHKYSLENGIATVGVLGHGLDKLYPSQNVALAHRMVENGGLLTEFMSKTVPDRENFPQRNRVIAGLSDVVIVVESGMKGGSLITADIANSYNRDVFAIPGKVGEDRSSGCNWLIKTNRAGLIETAGDLSYLMSWEDPGNRKMKQQQELFRELQPDETAIVDLLRNAGDSGIDVIISELRMSSGRVAAALLGLEFSGIISTLPGKVYRLVQR